MTYTIAMQPMDAPDNNNSPLIWKRTIQEAGHKVRYVNVEHSDILDQLKGCHGFMWRHSHMPNDKQIANALVPALAYYTDIELYPDLNTCWHYDNKIAQKYMFDLLGIPQPKTWVWFDSSLAKAFAIRAKYPMIMKLSAGASSSNVILIHSFQEAEAYIDELFGMGVKGLTAGGPERWWEKKMAIDQQWLRTSARVLMKRLPTYPPPVDYNAWEFHKNYVLFQEFLPNNEHDYRISVIGDRAFGYRRFNRPDDFRASGSGNFNTEPSKIDMRAVRLAFDATAKLKTQSLAFDFLRKGEDLLCLEISYAYVSWMVHECPGYWDRDLNWHEGQMWPEEAQAEDLLARLDSKYSK